jgi:hypothetical protein
MVFVGDKLAVPDGWPSRSQERFQSELAGNYEAHIMGAWIAAVCAGSWRLTHMGACRF